MTRQSSIGPVPRSHRRAVAAVAFALVLCSASPALAFRTGKDLADLAGTERVRIDASTVQFQIHNAPPATLALADVEQAASAAASAWSGLDCAALDLIASGTTTQAAAAGDGINTIQWVDDWSARGFDPQAAAMTDVQYVKGLDGKWKIAEGDILLNSAMTWATSPQTADAQDVQTVLTHELGHLLGLLHNCEPDGSDGAPRCDSGDFSSAVMYPIYTAGRYALTNDDRQGVCFLYPKVACEATGCQLGETCTPEGCRVACGDAVCAESEICTPKGCAPSGTCDGNECVGMACAADDDCGRLEHCVASVCQRGRGEKGDPCASGADRSPGWKTASPAGGPVCVWGRLCDRRVFIEGVLHRGVRQRHRLFEGGDLHDRGGRGRQLFEHQGRVRHCLFES